MFEDDLKLEEQFYNKIFKHWLNSIGIASIFIRFNSDNVVYKTLQKKNDIDVILDNGKENISLSLKTVRRIYNKIFFETISNCNTNSPGWGVYSKADWIIYSMGDFNIGFISRRFQLKDIPKGNKYHKGYGETRNGQGNLLYKTEGKLIPWEDFDHDVLFDSRKKKGERKIFEIGGEGNGRNKTKNAKKFFRLA